MIPFSVSYDDDSRASAWLNDQRLLALIRFGRPAAAGSDPRLCAVDLPELGGTTTAEVWLSARPVRAGFANGVGYASNGEVLFLRFQADEYASDALQPLTAMAYRRLFAVARAQGYPHVLRVWNYLPDINREVGGLERYRAFCAGRRQVLVAELAEFETHLPAACAIGTPSVSPLRGRERVGEGGLQIYALTAREAGVQVENPRQVSAFHYPRQYGPRSPSFSRAVLKAWGKRYHLYISGTASVVGHASRHSDLMAQLDETLANLDALLDQASRQAAAPLRPALLRVYLQPELDPAPARDRIAQAFGSAVPLVFLRADICRQELLVEIEGLATDAAP